MNKEYEQINPAANMPTAVGKAHAGQSISADTEMDDPYNITAPKNNGSGSVLRMPAPRK
jgi:hypothetical protein